VDLDEILYGGDAIQDDLYSILLNPIASFQNGGCLNFCGGEKNPLITFELMVDLVQILYVGDNNEGDVDHSIMVDI
jgi:hypothetical protein